MFYVTLTFTGLVNLVINPLYKNLDCYSIGILKYLLPIDSFSSSQKARDNEFTTWTERLPGKWEGQSPDRPLVVQFAANKVQDFVTSAQLVQGYCEGVDLNCGCPQRWAAQEGIGACLINKPDFIHDLVRQTKNQTCSGLSISVKIRIHADIKQ